MMPAVVLKKMVMGSFHKTETEADIADSIDFMVERVGHAKLDLKLIEEGMSLRQSIY